MHYSKSESLTVYENSFTFLVASMLYNSMIDEHVITADNLVWYSVCLAKIQLIS